MTPLEEVIERVSSGAKRVNVSGLAGSSKAYLLSRLILQGPKKTYVFLGTGGKEATGFLKDLEFCLGPFAEGEVCLFPPHDVLPFTRLSPHQDILSERLGTLHALTKRPPPSFVATTVTAILPFLPPKEKFEKPWTLKTGSEMDRDLFLKQLVEWGYQPVPVAIDRGNFAVRGGLVDLFSPLDRLPVRIEWAGERIESIREFDPKSQRSIALRDQATLIPAKEVLLNQETVKSFSEKIRKAGEEKDLPRPVWRPLIEKAKERISFSGLETYLPLFYDPPTLFWDWLPPDTILVAEDFSALTRVVEEHLGEIGTLLQGKENLLDPGEVCLPPAGFESGIERFPRISFSGVEQSEPLQVPAETHGQIRREIELARKKLEPMAPLARRLKEWAETDSVLLVASSRPQAERFSDLLSHYFGGPLPIVAESFPELPPEPGRIRILTGRLSGGFRLPSERVTLVTEEEIFGPKIRRRENESSAGTGFSSFAEIKEGDPIVHKEHGIGIYRGLVPMTIEGSPSDFLLIEYREGDKLYLPVYRMNLVQRYTGTEGERPRLDKLGGASWAKIRGKSEKAIRELAGELLNLYAARTAGRGFKFSPPNDLFEAFEASFPYEETPDQERAIAEVLEDMQKEKPMDRLVLGDVGYGKTEVALRAAYKAVLDGKQVAFLVPTTLLAFQHHERFIERFRNDPVRVEMLSRFRPAPEQKKIVGEIAHGRIDIIIGTHRLLQPDLSFKDLGLLIIDEEHRFGVEQKEKIRRLKKDVDLLALSATPIPRSLYMSLVGIRGLSVIETPPSDRLSIRTFVMPFEKSVIREAIIRELKRGGQVFFIHNEVESIDRMKDFLKKLVPEASIEVGHGQMEESKLEEIMIRFFHQKFNLLLCTTIVESGIDIPTANTILINKSDRMGLAQIYQLRGRVGRGTHRAYAYLMISEERDLTEEAAQRLSVLQRFSELGSGYKMASYDLEIRGAGNLLGREQSGHMAAIGYELYTELLEGAVRELKGEKVLEEIDPELHFRIPAYLPDSYVPEPSVRLELYRRLSSLDREEEIDPVAEELRDRFGPCPPEAENLLELAGVKALAKGLRIKQIRYDGKTFVYAFDPSSPLPPELLTQRIKKDPKRFRLTPDLRFSVHQPLPKETLALAETKKFLRELTLHLA